MTLRDKPWLTVVKDDRAAGGELQLLNQVPLVNARRVDMQGCCDVHGVDSLCGGE